MDKRITEALGWYGAVAIVGAYALLSFKVIPADGLIYQLLNLTGALGIIAISLEKKVRQPVALNTFWALIALVAIIRFILR